MVEAQYSKISAGMETSDGFNSWLTANAQNLKAAGIDPGQLAQDPKSFVRWPLRSRRRFKS